MKATLFAIVFLGLISMAMSRSAFLDDLFDSKVVVPKPAHTETALAWSCNATDTCAGKDDACTGNYNLGVSSGGCSKTNGTCCATGLYCVNKTCQMNNDGGSCNSAGDCFPAGQFNCVNKTCQYMMYIGDSCTANALCATGNCANGTCQGTANGSPCLISSQCNVGYYCDGNCTMARKEGAGCDSSDECAPGTVCSITEFSNTTKTCVAIGSQQEGEPCVEYLCTEGTVCGGNVMNMTCVSVNTSSEACTSPSNCTGLSICHCSAVTGTGFCVGPTYNEPCTGEANDLMSCLAENSCFFIPNSAPDSCTQNNCASQYKKSFSCACSLSNSLYGKCIYNQYCGGFPVWAIIVIIVVAIVLVLAIVLLVFFMMRRRRQYDSI